MTRAQHPGVKRPHATTAAVAVAVAATLAALSCGCDGPYQQFLDAVPATPPAGDLAPVQVFLGIDGMSRQAFDGARSRGAFAGWSAADLITVFPGTSDYAWTRTLRAGSMGGYEIQYFDPGDNSLHGAGLSGVAAHPFHEGIAGTYPCYQRFDFVGDGETWQLNSYVDPVAALPSTLDALFDVVAGRARTQSQVLAYLINVDVGSHEGGLDAAVAMLLEVDRRIGLFAATQPRPIRFTIFADHGNAHLRSTLIDPREVLRQVGIAPVEALSVGSATPPLEAVPIVHVRVNYVALHASAVRVPEIAARASTHPQVDLAVARLPDSADGAQRFGIWRRGQRYTFSRGSDGAITIDVPALWRWAGLDAASLPGHSPDELEKGGDDDAATFSDAESFEATRHGPYPDLFYRVATAFTHPAAQFPADILLSLPDDVASYGFTVPGAADIRAVDGFHGSLSRASTLSVLASQSFLLPAAVRSDDLADMFPILAGEKAPP